MGGALPSPSHFFATAHLLLRPQQRFGAQSSWDDRLHQAKAAARRPTQQQQRVKRGWYGVVRWSGWTTFNGAWLPLRARNGLGSERAPQLSGPPELGPLLCMDLRMSIAERSSGAGSAVDPW